MDASPGVKSIEAAKKLLAKPATPMAATPPAATLVLNLDTTGGAWEKSPPRLADPPVRQNRHPARGAGHRFQPFPDKLKKGKAVQLYYLGWNADYPGSGKFLLPPRRRREQGRPRGENAANYQNPGVRPLFRQMKAMDNTPRSALNHPAMNRILHRRCAPWVFGLHPKSYTLGHAWLKNRKPNDVGNNILKYQRIDATLRTKLRAEWNRPVAWPLVAGVLLILAAIGGGDRIPSLERRVVR